MWEDGAGEGEGKGREAVMERERERREENLVSFDKGEFVINVFLNYFVALVLIDKYTYL